METNIKYKKKRHGYSPFDMQTIKNVQQHPSHVKFVVPWQMGATEEEKADTKQNAY